MYEAVAIAAETKAEFYRELAGQLRGLIGDERDWVANAANTAALIFDSMSGLNWAGFYMVKAGELVLGPFQGKPACIRIAIGRGVCGTAAAERRSVLVDDVHAFPGHIACDAASRSELVVPLLRGDTVIGVIDLDSPDLARFDADDQAGIEALAAIFVAGSDLQRVVEIGPLKLKAQLFCGAETAMGPGKADLLEAIDSEGSISAAGRALGMSYRRTWLLVDSMNRCWSQRLVETMAGGSAARGARLTALGRAVLGDYRALETALAATAAPLLVSLVAQLRDVPLLAATPDDGSA